MPEWGVWYLAPESPRPGLSAVTASLITSQPIIVLMWWKEFLRANAGIGCACFFLSAAKPEIEL